MNNGNKITENVSATNKKIDIKDLGIIDGVLSSHFIFYKLSKAERMELIEGFQSFSASKNDIIFKQGDQGSMFFIISRGTVAIEIGGV